MKKLFLFVALFTWIGFSASAQVMKDSSKKEMRKESKEMKKESKMDHMAHHWIMKDGKVMEMKNGKEHHMTTETKLMHGEWIRPNGEVVMKDNKVVHLKNGEYVDEEGMIHTMSHEKK